MDPLDIFRQSWQAEIFGEKSRPMISCQPTGDLCRVGSKSNHAKRLCDDECDTTTPSISLSIPPPIGNSSFTIGIKTFAVTKAPIPPTPAVEPSTKKCKTRSTLLDLLIHDIDEATAVPFFNLSLPREIALKIFDFLSIKDLYACLQVCRPWNILSSDNLLWLNLYKRLQLERSNITLTDDWKENVKNAILFEQQLVKNFRNHQCRTTKLTYRLGVVLTCADNDLSTIIAGYSTGIIRTWSIPSILNVDPAFEDPEQFDTPDIIYESIDHDEDVILSPVKAVGLLKNDLYAIHDDGLVEVWKRDVSDKPRFRQNLFTSSIEQIQHAETFLCVANRTNFSVWNFDQIDVDPQFQQMNFFEEFNDDLLSFCMSTSHSVPIALLAGRKSLWCTSLSNFQHRAAFYSILRSDYVRKIPMDIHHDEPIAVVGLGGRIKLFDLQQGRCEILNNEYNSLPSNVHLIRAKQCPNHEFLVAFDNYQISVFDRRQKFGAIQHFYGHHAPITTLQMDSWKISSTDTYGFVRLWDRRMHPQSLWQINPQVHPVSHCSFDQQTLICALTPLSKHPDMLEYQINSDPISGHIYVCNFNCDISTQLDEDLQICTSTYDAPKASNRRIALYTPYDSIL